MTYDMGGIFIPVCKDPLAWVAIPTRENTLMVKVESINDVRLVIKK